MKQLLLFSIALVITGSLLAQTTTKQSPTPTKYVPFENILFSSQLTTNDNSFSSNELFKLPDVVNHPLFSPKRSALTRSAGVAFYKIGSSININTLLHSQSNCLQINTALNLIMFTHRACRTYAYEEGGNGGWINTSYSLDGGVTWDTTVLPMHEGGYNNGITPDTGCRYPSGAIYNPIGNTNPTKAYGVVSGPYTNNTNWSGYYFGSERLDDSMDNEQVYRIVDTPATFNEYWPNVATTVAGNKAYVLGVDEWISATSNIMGLFKGAVLNTGTFDTTSKSFNWTQQEVHIPVAIKPQDLSIASSNPVDTIQYINPTSSSDMAWSATGDTGYIVQFGVDSAQLSLGTAGYYPIVYKTTDSGKVWTKLPFYAFSADTNVTKFLLPNQDGSYSPFIGATNGSKCLVDYNGNLHIITDVESGFSSGSDSLDYTYAPSNGNIPPQYIYDLSTSDGTSWNNIFVDTILSFPGASEQWSESGSGSPAEFVDARIQASLTPDRTKEFITWLDSDPTIDGYNDAPDIFSKGFDFTDGYKTPTVNFTAPTDYTTECYWLFVAPTAFSNSGTYTIPATISEPWIEDDYYGDSSVYHYYVSGISFTDSDFNANGTSAIATIAKSNIGVSFYPNPSNGDVNVSFTQYTGQASILVTNILGSVVKQFNDINIADNQISLNLEDLQSGIYFVRVETAQGSETQKIVIAKNQ